MKTEPRWLTEATLLAIHAQQIERFGAFGAMRLVGNAKEMRKRFADLRHADAITFQEYVFRIAV